MTELAKCVKCGGTPSTIRVDGLVYIQCDCTEWPPYNFMGVRLSSAVERWNFWNRPINRYQTSQNLTPEERMKKNKDYEKAYQRQYYAKKKGKELCK